MMLWQVELRGDPSWYEGLYCGGPEAVLWGGVPIWKGRRAREPVESGVREEGASR